jgi:Flp pilus assembly protein TadD
LYPKPQSVLFEPLADEEVSEALRLAARATELEPDDEAVMAICAFVFASLSDEFERAGALADRAVALNPNLASAWSAKGWMSLYLRDPSLSLEAFGRAIRLNPLDPFLLPNILFWLCVRGPVVWRI